MEYIPGQSLYRVVADGGPLPVPRAARLGAEVASALDHAHHQGLIHRDLKPSNIIITPHDHAKVLDLGLALVQGESGADREVIGGVGYVLGTMDYIAPEQAADSSKVDPRTDIYALGCTLYYAVTGRPPFPGGTATEKIHRHRTEEPTPVSQLNPAVPTEFQALLSRMMAKDPAQRIATAAAVQEELLVWAKDDAAQPLDQPDDMDYQQAVARIEAEQPATDLGDEVIAMAPATQLDRSAATADVDLAPFKDLGAAPETPAPSRRPSRLAQLHAAWREQDPTGTGLVLFLILIGVGLLCLGIMGIAALVLLWKHGHGV
jgi:serine/threonine protein kinase